jgi:hypothetical protein
MIGIEEDGCLTSVDAMALLNSSTTLGCCVFVIAIAPSEGVGVRPVALQSLVVVAAAAVATA